MVDLGFPGCSVKGTAPIHLLTDLSWMNKEDRACTGAESDQWPEEIGLYITDGMAYTKGVNHSYEDMTEIMEEEVVGKHMQKLVDLGFFDRSVALLVIKNRTPITIEQTIMRTGKKVIATGNPIFDYLGNIVMVLTINKLKPSSSRFSSNQAEGRADLIPYVLPTMPGVIAYSKVMQDVLMRTIKIAAFDSTVLIQGETGVGKAVVADLIHRMSSRLSRPFIKVNMAAIPDELLESELFGYKGGAFTGALKSGKPGLIQSADGGTVFLDEIAELSLSNQAKLLQLLQDKEVLPLGSVNTQRVNVRFIAATNRDLQEMVLAGTFREDLFYRLNVVPIYIPPLRERKEDIFNLAQHFLADFSQRHKISKQFTASAVQVLTDYNWPGNVRELQNIIERTMLLYPQIEITGEQFLQELAMKTAHHMKKVTPSLQHTLHEEITTFEIDLLLEALRHCDGNLQKAASTLGIHRTTLLRKLQKYSLNKFAEA